MKRLYIKAYKGTRRLANPRNSAVFATQHVRLIDTVVVVRRGAKHRPLLLENGLRALFQDSSSLFPLGNMA